MNTRKQHLKPWISITVAAIIFVFCALNPLWLLEYRVGDAVHQRSRNVNSEIVIFGIDEYTVSQLGPLHNCDVQLVVEAIDILNSHMVYKPSVIAVSNINNQPFQNINNVVFGSHDVIMNRDGVIREVILTNAFAVTIAEMHTGQSAADITGGRNTSIIPYVGEPDTFYRHSFVDIFSDAFDPSQFANKIVLIGPTDMANNFAIPISHGTTMYGIEIQANVLQMLLEGRFVQHVSETTSILIIVLILLLGMLIGQFLDIYASLAIYVATGIGYCILAMRMFDQGYMLPLLLPLTVLALIGIYQFAYHNIQLSAERIRIRASFKKYLDPKLADSLISDRSIDTEAVGKKREIAVLFADVRGFTQMAESLRETPELVVEILNDFLELTTTSVFTNGGSVDKFIGDATMAVFNGFAPQNDYIYSAVKTAWDILQKAEEVSAPIKNHLGINLAFGIGVHCGEAIVGNLGPPFRKDYTAIGDMVNVAQRLESNASRSEILISKDVYDALVGRIEAESVGEMLLKGKSESVEVFALQGFV